MNELQETGVSAPASLRKLGIICIATIAVLGAASLALRAEPHRLLVLRGILGLMATGEALASYSYLFNARNFTEVNGRPYKDTYHGVMQDFGLYNLANATLLTVVAIHPLAYRAALNVVLGLYIIHGSVHVARYFGWFFGGETRVRSPRFELRDALTLLVAATGVLLFYP